MILVLDNYDSFTYNLVQLIGSLGAEVNVVRNDQTTLPELEAMAPTHVVISPGPGRPENAGLSMATIQHFAKRCPVLGVCLGHQSLAQSLGSKIDLAPQQMHGKPSQIHHNNEGLFRDLPNPFSAGRYHSLIVPQENLPTELQVTARTEAGEIMALSWRGTFATGVQFHPESVLTPDGEKLIRNFLEEK